MFCCQRGSMPFKDRWLALAQVLAIVGFLTCGGGSIGFIGFIITMCTTCSNVSTCGLVTSAVLSFLAFLHAAYFGFMFLSVNHGFAHVLAHTLEEIGMEDVWGKEGHDHNHTDELTDIVKRIMTILGISSAVSAAAWIFCGIAMVVFIEKNKAAMANKEVLDEASVIQPENQPNAYGAAGQPVSQEDDVPVVSTMPQKQPSSPYEYVVEDEAAA